MSSVKASLPRAAQPSGTSPEGLAPTSRPSAEASTPWKASIVSRSRVEGLGRVVEEPAGQEAHHLAGRWQRVAARPWARDSACTGTASDGPGLALALARLGTGAGVTVAPGSACCVTLMQAETSSGSTTSSGQRAARRRERTDGPPSPDEAAGQHGRHLSTTATPYQGSASPGGAGRGARRRPDGSGYGRLPAGGVEPRRRSELRTTLTELKAMAAAASMGSSRSPKNG